MTQKKTHNHIHELTAAAVFCKIIFFSTCTKRPTTFLTNSSLILNFSQNKRLIIQKWIGILNNLRIFLTCCIPRSLYIFTYNIIYKVCWCRRRKLTTLRHGSVWLNYEHVKSFNKTLSTLLEHQKFKFSFCECSFVTLFLYIYKWVFKTLQAIKTLRNYYNTL